MAKVLRKEFFARDAVRVARSFLGCYLVRRIGNKNVRLKITETEAYLGENDLASHARFGKTKRNLIMYGPAGYFYVYFVYGNHWLLNVVTGKTGQPQAVLIRSAGDKTGPARLTKRLRITGAFNDQAAEKKSGLWFEIGEQTSSRHIIKLPRIGVSYARQIWSNKRLRFCIKSDTKKHKV